VPRPPRPPIVRPVVVRPSLRSFDELGPVAREEIREEFSSYVDSRPPPQALLEVEARVVQRVTRDSDTRDAEPHTGRHDIEELKRLLQAKIEADAAEKLLEERERRKEAQQELARLREKAEIDRQAQLAVAEGVRLKLEAELRTVRDASSTRVDQRWDKKWALFATLLAIIVSALVGRYIGAPSGGGVSPPSSSSSSSEEK
jgi:hypothetical protein